MDFQDFYQGREFAAYDWLGAHVLEDGSVAFRTFAPSAKSVSVLVSKPGSSSKPRELPLSPVYDGNYYELVTAPGTVDPGDLYEFRVVGQDGKAVDHCDPFGRSMELRPAHRSIVCAPSTFSFSDQDWMDARTDCFNKPLSIYELHVGSWIKPDDNPEHWYTYEELAEPLADYVTEMGYTHVELLPVTEHPTDESWGYQTTGFFSPTSRYGTPDQLRTMIDTLHRRGIGVIFDFTPTHFAIDDYGLGRYDGTALFEYPSSDVGESEWGSYNFLHSRGEVRSFLQSCANYWLSEFHGDGIRMDAVSRIIYWQGDESRGENGTAIEFLKIMNRGLKERHPSAMLIAEDSTAYEGVTKPVDKGGLGFDYKWDLGWMHDTLELFQAPPADRPNEYHKLTFPLMYFVNERYLLPLSHDEVVHGKATILQKMNGQYEEKFPQARTLYLFMMTRPGKKLNFMGNEFGQLREWDEKRQQDWNLFDFPIHNGFRLFIEELNEAYLAHPSLWERDYEPDGFTWIDCHEEKRCLYAFEREGGGERTVAVLNLSDKEQEFEFEVKGASALEPVIDTDENRFGGTREGALETVAIEDGKAAVTMAPLSGQLYLVAE